jgi:hypothetical protein
MPRAPVVQHTWSSKQNIIRNLIENKYVNRKLKKEGVIPCLEFLCLTTISLWMMKMLIHTDLEQDDCFPFILPSTEPFGIKVGNRFNKNHCLNLYSF